MFDLANDETSHALIREFVDADKVVAGVCHGSIALANVELDDGSFLVAGQPVTGFSNAEEEEIQLTEAMPFLVETVLQQNGGQYGKAPETWAEYLASGRDGKLLTGQNANSAGPLARLVLEEIGA